MTQHTPSECPPRPVRRARSTLVGPGLALAAIVLLAAALRPGATSVGPLMTEITGGLGMSAAVAGVLTSLPGFTFAAIGVVAVTVSRRIGLTGALLLGMVLLVVGLLARTFTGSTVAFLACTLVLLTGMGLGTILVPPWIKRHGGEHVTRLMTAYSVTLLLGGSIGSMLASPIAQLAPGGWRAALGMWGLVAIVGSVPWIILARRERADLADRAGAALLPPTGSLLRSPTAKALAAFCGAQFLIAYVQFGWMPQMFRDAGLSANAAGVMLGLVSLVGIVGGFLTPPWIARSENLTLGMLGLGLVTVIAWIGMLVAPASLPWLWAVLMGIGAWTFPAGIAMITARTKEPEITARVSGFVQPFAYLMAGLGPLVVGVVYEAAGSWTAILWGLVVVSVLMTVAALRLTRQTYVDDEIRLNAA